MGTTLYNRIYLGRGSLLARLRQKLQETAVHRTMAAFSFQRKSR